MRNPIESTGPITRPSPIDPVKLEAWPIACVLAYIHSLDSGFLPEQRDDLVRQAYRHGARAFPVDMLAASRKLLDFAASRPECLALRHHSGVVESQYLGPEAQISVALTDGMLDFYLRYPQFGTEKKVSGLWCLARQVRAAWPWQIRPIAGAETRCREWLIQEMGASSDQTTTPKIEWYRAACKKFRGLGNVENLAPSKSFERAWTAACTRTGAKWNLSGRKKSKR
jgi:hypothetical protein